MVKAPLQWIRKKIKSSRLSHKDGAGKSDRLMSIRSKRRHQRKKDKHGKGGN